MKFKSFTNIIDESFKDTYGFDFNDLMQAAINGDGEFVLNPIPTDDVIDLSEKQWDSLYAVMFDTDSDTVYNKEEHEEELKKERLFAKRYNCV